jgi:uncharacterized protein (TIGR02118 family)
LLSASQCDFLPPAAHSAREAELVKAVTFVKRRPGMSVEAFQEYWRTRHADVVVKMPGIRRYVQSHALPSGYRGRELPYDGIAEMWFDDTGAMKALRGDPAYASVQADEASFIDRAQMGLLITEEHVIVDRPAPVAGVKSVELVTRKAGMPVDEFQRYWREVHGPIAATIPVLRRYVQSHTRRPAYEGGRAPAYDGVAITWFDDTQAMRVSAATPEYARTRADEPNFLDTGRLPVIITREHVVVA